MKVGRRLIDAVADDKNLMTAQHRLIAPALGVSRQAARQQFAKAKQPDPRAPVDAAAPDIVGRSADGRGDAPQADNALESRVSRPPRLRGQLQHLGSSRNVGTCGRARGSAELDCRWPTRRR